MRYLFLAVVGALTFTGAASAQQPYYPAAAAATPLQPAAGAVAHTSGAACSNCGPGTTAARGFTMSGIRNVTGGDCRYGYPCQSGCGSVRSDLGFHFGSCKNFFAPCGPAPLNAPWGKGFSCPRPYDSYANH